MLGPSLFLYFINDMSMALRCHLALYADDSVLIASGPDAGSVADFLSEQPTSCKTWLIDNHLLLHEGKTESILFGTLRKLKGMDFIVRCGNAVVKRVTSVKYLLDLNFSEHAMEILKATGKLDIGASCALP